MTIRSLVGEATGYGESRFSIAGANPSALDGNFESIVTYRYSALGNNILNITGIPQTYKHLQLRIFCRINNGNNYGDVDMTFNNNTSALYDRYLLFGTGGGTASQSASSNQSKIVLPVIGTGTTGTYATHIIDFPDYTNTSKFKSMLSFYGREYNSGSDAQVGVLSGTWRNTSALSSIHFYCLADFTPGTSFALYGVKA